MQETQLRLNQLQLRLLRQEQNQLKQNHQMELQSHGINRLASKEDEQPAGGCQVKTEKEAEPVTAIQPQGHSCNKRL